MDAVVLTLAMYFTPTQIALDTPTVTIMTFDTFAECEYYIEAHTPAIQKELADSLLGYSATCIVK